MESNKIASSATWERFVKVAQQARMRNSGLTENISTGKSPNVQRKTVTGGIPEIQQKIGPQTVAFGQGYVKHATPTPRRILGGKFDAWA